MASECQDGGLQKASQNVVFQGFTGCIILGLMGVLLTLRLE